MDIPSISRDELVAKGARFVSGEELIAKRIDPGLLEINFFFSLSDALYTLKMAGIKFDEATEEVVYRNDKDHKVVEIAIYPKDQKVVVEVVEASADMATA